MRNLTRYRKKRKKRSRKKHRDRKRTRLEKHRRKVGAPGSKKGHGWSLVKASTRKKIRKRLEADDE